MKIAVLYDSLYSYGGAEKMALELATYFKADLIVSGVDKNIHDYKRTGINIIEIGSTLHKYNKSLNYLIEIPLRFFISKRSFRYDVYIFTGTQTLFAAQKNKNNIWLCHTPNRMLYDFNSMNLDINPSIQLIFVLYRFIFSILDRIFVTRMTKIVSNSRHISKRIQNVYGRSSILVYPGVKTDLYKFSGMGRFYLTVSRLYPAKRVGVVVKAFQILKREKLIIVGDGPSFRDIQNKTSGNENIKLLKFVADTRLRKLYATCKAVIYIPKNEDFGIVPVEAIASGKQCITVREGGIKEIIRNGVNGYFVNPDPVSLAKFIDNFNPRMTGYKNIQNTAKKFDVSIFRKKWESIVFGGGHV